MPLENLLELVETLRTRINEHGAALRKNETLTRYALIDPLLRELGWDTADPSIVVPEDPAGRGRADYTLRTNGQPAIVVEAKKLGSGLQEGASQAVNYAMDRNRSARYFSITDGNHWEIYDTEQPANAMNIMSFDIMSGSPTEVCLKAMALWRQSVQNGSVSAAQTPIVGLDAGQQATTQGTVDNSNATEQPTVYAPTPAATPQTQPEIHIRHISPPNTSRTLHGWTALNELHPEPGSKPAELLLPDNSRIGINSWVSLTSEIAKWLFNSNFLLDNHYPIQIGKRYIIAEKPFHSNGNRFTQPKQVGHFYIEGQYQLSHHIRNSMAIVERTGQDPSQFKVRLSS